MYGTLDNLQKYRKKTPHFFWLDAEGFIFAVITIAVPNFQPVLYISTHFFLPLVLMMSEAVGGAAARNSLTV